MALLVKIENIVELGSVPDQGHSAASMQEHTYGALLVVKAWSGPKSAQVMDATKTGVGLAGDWEELRGTYVRVYTW